MTTVLRERERERERERITRSAHSLHFNEKGLQSANVHHAGCTSLVSPSGACLWFCLGARGWFRTVVLVLGFALRAARL